MSRVVELFVGAVSPCRGLLRGVARALSRVDDGDKDEDDDKDNDNDDDDGATDPGREGSVRYP